MRPSHRHLTTTVVFSVPVPRPPWWHRGEHAPFFLAQLPVGPSPQRGAKWANFSWQTRWLRNQLSPSGLGGPEEPRQKYNKQCSELHIFGHFKMLWAPFHKAFAFVIGGKKIHLRASRLRLTDSFLCCKFLQEQLQIVHRLIISRVLYQDISPSISFVLSEP